MWSQERRSKPAAELLPRLLFGGWSSSSLQFRRAPFGCEGLVPRRPLFPNGLGMICFMGPETLPAKTASSTLPGPSSPADKIRLRFRKDGALRLLSHHDLMRTF